VSPHACDACLRKSALIGFLGARLSAVLGGLDSRLGSVLALGEAELIAAVAGRQAAEARRFSAGFDAEGSRRSLAETGVEAVCPHGGAYPVALLTLADVPPVIYLTGGVDRLRELTQAPVATVVGARTPSRYAIEVALDLGRGLAAAGSRWSAGSPSASTPPLIAGPWPAEEAPWACWPEGWTSPTRRPIERSTHRSATKAS
jgi:hypothetical protein